MESAALAAANQRIQELENEVKILRKAAAAVEELVPPKRVFELVTELAGEGVPVTQGRGLVVLVAVTVIGTLVPNPLLQRGDAPSGCPRS
ncbi:hypothetical protein ACQEU6_01005 [Spirillospora sp. CA-108201]